MLFQDKEKRYKTLLIFIIPLLVLLLVFGFLTYSSATSLLGVNKSSSKNSYDIDEYDYHLRSNATELQVELFKELDVLLKNGADDLEIAESVVKNFVADAYTWDNKKGQWDVGGMCFVYSPIKESIYLGLKDGFYGLLSKYQEDYGKTGLLEVINVDVTDSKISIDKYVYHENEYESFDIVCEWEFSSESRFANKVDHSLYFKVIKNKDNRFEIVENY